MTYAFPPPTSGMCLPKKARRKPNPERLIEQAIQEAFLLKFRIRLHKTNAGGTSDKKGVMRCPGDLAAALNMPRACPWGIEPWIALPPGFPDLVGMWEGRPMFIEVKAPGGHFRPGQKEFLSARLQEGFIAFHADSVSSAIQKFEQLRRVVA